MEDKLYEEKLRLYHKLENKDLLGQFLEFVLEHVIVYVFAFFDLALSIWLAFKFDVGLLWRFLLMLLFMALIAGAGALLACVISTPLEKALNKRNERIRMENEKLYDTIMKNNKN